MKNFIKTSLFIGVLFTSIITSAMSNDPSVKVSLIDSKRINLSLQNFDGKIDVYVKDEKGVILYDENFEGIDFSKKFDFNSMPVGDYIIEIDGQTKIKVVPFTVSKKGINFNEDAKSYIFKPVVRVDRNNVFVTKLALDNQPMQVDIYDVHGNLLHREELKGTINLARKFNISMLEKGEYKLVMKTENRIFSKNLKKN